MGRINWSNAGLEGGVAEQGFRSVRWASRFIVVSTDTLRAPERRDGAQGCARYRVRHPISCSGCGSRLGRTAEFGVKSFLTVKTDPNDEFERPQF